MARQKLLMGNWKMYKTAQEAQQFAKELRARAEDLNPAIEYVICPPFTALHALCGSLPSVVQVGAQNAHAETDGAFTGEVSVPMLADAGARYVIVGHSERRHLFSESDEVVRRKAHAVMKGGLIPVVCVGEDLRQKELNHTLRVVERQTVSGLAELSSEQVANSVVAYEPVWAIGSGHTPTPDDAERVIAAIRAVIAREKGDAAADAVRILYGGSVKPGNVAGFTQQPDIDGALVGGASLQAQSFIALAHAMAEGVK